MSKSQEIVTARNTKSSYFLLIGIIVGATLGYFTSESPLLWTVIAGVIGALCGWLVWKIWPYILESYDELRFKVTWPTWSELQSSSIIVLITTIIIAAIIWVMDSVSSSALKAFYDMF